METRLIGRSGLRVSAVGLGCNNFGGRIDFESSRQVLHAALDAGITCLDTADIYGVDGGSESTLGALLGARRKDVVIATKFAQDMKARGTLKSASRHHIMQAVEDSLQRLRTDYIDLYQQHLFDPSTPIDETLRALDDLVRQGKVRYIGCSNFRSWQVVDAHWTARHLGLSHFICCQDEYSLLQRKIEAELLPAMRHLGMGLLPYYPLASGLLTGKYAGDNGSPGQPLAGRLAREPNLRDRFMSAANIDRVSALNRFASDRGRTILELAMSWVASRPGVASVIAGATSVEQVHQNVHAVQWQLTPEDLVAIEAL